MQFKDIELPVALGMCVSSNLMLLDAWERPLGFGVRAHDLFNVRFLIRRPGYAVKVAIMVMEQSE